MPTGIYPRHVIFKKRHAVTQPQDASYRFIPLTKNQTAIIDATDFEWLSKFNWCASWNPHLRAFYAQKGKGVSMHRFILGCKAGEIGDHINGNTLDNRRENLRKCTMAESNRNRKLHRRNRSGFKGVSLANGKWEAVICIDGTDLRLGRYTSPQKAARAYDEAAKRYHGVFASLNFPLQVQTTRSSGGPIISAQ
jgi:hypothetical protein